MFYNLSQTHFIKGMVWILQDTLTAMEALTAFTQVDPNRNVFDMQVLLESSAQPNWRYFMLMTKGNYTTLQKTAVGL